MGHPPQRNRVKVAEAALVVAEAKRDAYLQIAMQAMAGWHTTLATSDQTDANDIVVYNRLIARLEELA